VGGKGKAYAIQRFHRNLAQGVKKEKGNLTKKGQVFLSLSVGEGACSRPAESERTKGKKAKICLQQSEPRTRKRAAIKTPLPAGGRRMGGKAPASRFNGRSKKKRPFGGADLQ